MNIARRSSTSGSDSGAVRARSATAPSRRPAAASGLVAEASRSASRPAQALPHRSASGTRRSSNSLAATPRKPGALPGRNRTPAKNWPGSEITGTGPVSGPATNSESPSQMTSMHASGRTRPADVALGRDTQAHATLLRGLHLAGHSAYQASEGMASASHQALTVSRVTGTPMSHRASIPSNYGNVWPMIVAFEAAYERGRSTLSTA